MHKKIICKRILISLSLVALCGCAQPTVHPPTPLVTDVYDEVHREGARDTVQLLREGMRSNRMYGSYDPYIPLRLPDEIIPVYVPPRPDPKTGRLIHGHWEESIIKWSDWYTQ